MKNFRIIPRLDVKGPNIVKGVHLEGLRVIGNPGDLAKKYYEEGADEILYMDIVASLYQRNNLTDIVKKAAQEIFIPLTVGGGVRSLEDIDKLLRSGADKVAINTAAINNPRLINDAAKRFGSQCIVVSVEAKKISENVWHCFTDNGREKTGVNVIEWCQKVVDLGAGEILLTSIDKEGTFKAFDIGLVEKISPHVKIPVIACGGAGSPQDIQNVIEKGKADAVAVASILHYEKFSLLDIKKHLNQNNIGIRLIN